MLFRSTLLKLIIESKLRDDGGSGGGGGGGGGGSSGVGVVRVASLTFIDLAGSERLSRSGATGDRLKEAQAKAEGTTDALVVASGAFGLWLSRWLPPRLTRSGESLVFERIPMLRHRLVTEAEDIVGQMLRTSTGAGHRRRSVTRACRPVMPS